LLECEDLEWNQLILDLYILYMYICYVCMYEFYDGVLLKWLQILFVALNDFIDRSLAFSDHQTITIYLPLWSQTLLEKPIVLLTYLLTYGAEPFLRSRQLYSYSRTSQYFMEPEGSLPCSQEPSTVPILSQMDLVQTITSYLSKIYFNTVHPPTS
jgi:hypothetical protein